MSGAWHTLSTRGQPKPAFFRPLSGKQSDFPLIRNRFPRKIYPPRFSPGSELLCSDRAAARTLPLSLAKEL